MPHGFDFANAKSVGMGKEFERMIYGMKYEIETINDLCKKITDGSHFSPEHEDSGEYQMYSVKDMEYNGFNNSNCKMIGKEMFMKLLKSDCRPLKNDILIAKDGSYLKYAFKIKEDLNR